MRAYIAVFLLTAGLVAPALAEMAPQLVNVQQPDGERAAQLKRQKAYRRAAAARAAQAKQTRATRAAPPRVAQSSGPTRIVPGNQVAPAASSSSSWSSSMLSWWRGVEPAECRAGHGSASLGGAGGSAGGNSSDHRTSEDDPPQGASHATQQIDRNRGGAGNRAGRGQGRKADAKQAPQRQAQPIAGSSGCRPSGAARQADRSRDIAPPEPRPKPVNSARQETAPPAAEDSTVGSISPAEVKERGGSRMAALSSEHAADGGEATWWQRQGNPVVFNFGTVSLPMLHGRPSATRTGPGPIC